MIQLRNASTQSASVYLASQNLLNILITFVLATLVCGNNRMEMRALGRCLLDNFDVVFALFYFVLRFRLRMICFCQLCARSRKTPSVELNVIRAPALCAEISSSKTIPRSRKFNRTIGSITEVPLTFE